jgi:hypothetical protein
VKIGQKIHVRKVLKGSVLFNRCDGYCAMLATDIITRAPGAHARHAMRASMRYDAALPGA